MRSDARLSVFLIHGASLDDVTDGTVALFASTDVFSERVGYKVNLRPRIDSSFMYGGVRLRRITISLSATQNTVSCSFHVNYDSAYYARHWSVLLASLVGTILCLPWNSAVAGVFQILCALLFVWYGWALVDRDVRLNHHLYTDLQGFMESGIAWNVTCVPNRQERILKPLYLLFSCIACIGTAGLFYFVVADLLQWPLLSVAFAFAAVLSIIACLKLVPVELHRTLEYSGMLVLPVAYSGVLMSMPGWAPTPLPCGAGLLMLLPVVIISRKLLLGWRQSWRLLRVETFSRDFFDVQNSSFSSLIRTGVFKVCYGLVLCLATASIYVGIATSLLALLGVRRLSSAVISPGILVLTIPGWIYVGARIVSIFRVPGNEIRNPVSPWVIAIASVMEELRAHDAIENLPVIVATPIASAAIGSPVVLCTSALGPQWMILVPIHLQNIKPRLAEVLMLHELAHVVLHGGRDRTLRLIGCASLMGASAWEPLFASSADEGDADAFTMKFLESRRADATVFRDAIIYCAASRLGDSQSSSEKDWSEITDMECLIASNFPRSFDYSTRRRAGD